LGEWEKERKIEREVDLGNEGNVKVIMKENQIDVDITIKDAEISQLKEQIKKLEK
jgi:hypothetical protein